MVSRRWRVSLAAIAVLAFAAAMAPAVHAGGKLIYVAGKTTPLSAKSNGRSKASCLGNHVVGGGQYVLSPFSGAQLTASTPFDGKDRHRTPDDGWRSTVRNFNAGDKLTVFAICIGTPKTYKRDRFSTGPGRDARTGRVNCPRGTHVTGGGVSLPVAYKDRGWLEASAPFDDIDGDAKTDDGWTATGGVEKRKVKMKLTAICAGSRFGKLKYANIKGSAPKMGSGESSAPCPGDTHVTGGGVTTEGVAFHPMTISSPFDSTDNNMRPENGWQGEFDNYSNSDPGVITTYTICRL